MEIYEGKNQVPCDYNCLCAGLFRGEEVCNGLGYDHNEPVEPGGPCLHPESKGVQKEGLGADVLGAGSLEGVRIVVTSKNPPKGNKIYWNF